MPLTVWTVIRVGLTLASVPAGHVWRDVEPWTGPVRTARRLIGWHGAVGLSRLGHLPAGPGCIAFTWFEIVSMSPADPLTRHGAVWIIWMAQFTIILAAHLLAVPLSFRLSPPAESAPSFRTHLPMTLPMVAYTNFGLWLHSAPTGT